MKFNKHLMTGALLFAIVAIIQSYLVAGASRLVRRDTEYHQQLDQSPQTDPILNLEAIKQQQQQQNQQQAESSRRQQYVMNNNGPDVAALVENSNQPLIRIQRSPSYNQAPLVPLAQLTSQQLQQLEDEALRRQLPDLIAQARTDKTVERVLLRMLINASLRPALPNVAGRQTSPYYNGRANLWQDGVVGNLNAFEPPRMSSRLEQQALDNYASADPLGSDLGQTYQQDQYQSVVDKREYIKPCSFNAVSCAKNPFRKL